METTISEMKNILDEMDSRLDFRKDTELNGIAIETIQNKRHREKGNLPN